MPLILLRHTRVAGCQGLCYGNSEVPLAESFDDEAGQVLAHLPEPWRIYSSPSQRCLALARRLAGRYPKAPLCLDDRLVEMDLGGWQGRAWADVPRAEVDLWVEDFFQARPHGGESVAMLQVRVDSFLRDLFAASAEETVVAVTHKGVIRAALACSGVAEAWQANPGFGESVVLKERTLKPV